MYTCVTYYQMMLYPLTDPAAFAAVVLVSCDSIAVCSRYTAVIRIPADRKQQRKI